MSLPRISRGGIGLNVNGRSWQEDGTLSARYWSEAAKERDRPASSTSERRALATRIPAARGHRRDHGGTADRATRWTMVGSRPRAECEQQALLRADPQTSRCSTAGQKTGQLIAQRLRSGSRSQRILTQGRAVEVLASRQGISLLEVTLDEATDDLYAADLEAFVSERTRLARELRDAGDREAAEQLAKLKKPTVAAWALNQLARRKRRDVDLLLDAGHRLRHAQEGVVGGADRAAFEQAQTTEREALRRLTQQASELLGGASSQVLSQLSQTLRAAAVSEEGRELLARGDSRRRSRRRGSTSSVRSRYRARRRRSSRPRRRRRTTSCGRRASGCASWSRRRRPRSGRPRG